MITLRNTAIILFLEGLASSGLQMITIRQTVPYVGSSVLTTSIVISCFLGALALGYYKGGQRDQKDYIRTLTNNLVFSITIFGIGLSYLFTHKFFLTISLITENTIFHSPLLHLFVFCCLVMSPLVFFLGQTVPLLLNSFKNSSKSEAAGNATAMSTIGNVVGCLFTSLILMYYLSVGTAIFVNCLILAVCLFFIKTDTLKIPKRIFPIVAICLIVSHYLNVKVENLFFDETTPYSNYNVQESSDRLGNQLIINRSHASYISFNERKGWPYVELLRDFFLSVPNLHNKNILVLGAGGFTISAADDFGANFTYVDVDPEIKDIAEDRFLNEKINGQFIADDARRFLLTQKKKWDYIIVDLYTNAATLPSHTATIEFFKLVQSRLKPDGRSIINIAANPMLNDKYSINMDKTIRSAFDFCITDLSRMEDTLVNILYFCQPEVIIDNKQLTAQIYSDHTTRVTIDGYQTFFSKAWRGY